MKKITLLIFLFIYLFILNNNLKLIYFNKGYSLKFIVLLKNLILKFKPF